MPGFALEQLLAALDGLTLWDEDARAASSDAAWAGGVTNLALARAEKLRQLLDAAPVSADSSQSDMLAARLMLSDLAIATSQLRAASRGIRAQLDAIRTDLGPARQALDRPNPLEDADTDGRTR